MLGTKVAVKYILRSIGIEVPVPLGILNYLSKVSGYYQDNVKYQTYNKAVVFWELAFHDIIAISLWGSIVKIEFDDDTYGYAACNLHFSSQTTAQKWETVLNDHRKCLALPGSTG